MYSPKHSGNENLICWLRGASGEFDGLFQVINLFPEVLTPILLELQAKIYCRLVDHQHYPGLHRRILIFLADGTGGYFRLRREY